MSAIYQALKSSSFYKKLVFPSNLIERDLIKEVDDTYAVVCVLKPSDDKNLILRKNKLNYHFEKIFSELEDNRNEIIVFLINCRSGIFYKRYNPYILVSVYTYKNQYGIFDRELGFDIWMLKFSAEFVCKENVLLGEKKIYNDFLKTFDEGIIKEEIHAVAGLMSLQYFQ